MMRLTYCWWQRTLLSLPINHTHTKPHTVTHTLALSFLVEFVICLINTNGRMLRKTLEWLHKPSFFLLVKQKTVKIRWTTFINNLCMSKSGIIHEIYTHTIICFDLIGRRALFWNLCSSKPGMNLSPHSLLKRFIVCITL